MEFTWKSLTRFLAITHILHTSTKKKLITEIIKEPDKILD